MSMPTAVGQLDADADAKVGSVSAGGGAPSADASDVGADVWGGNAAGVPPPLAATSGHGQPGGIRVDGLAGQPGPRRPAESSSAAKALYRPPCPPPSPPYHPSRHTAIVTSPVAATCTPTVPPQPTLSWSSHNCADVDVTGLGSPHPR